MTAAAKKKPLALMTSKVIMRAPIPTTAKAVAAVLLDRYNWKTGRCDPGLGSIARLAKCSRSGVRKAVDDLERDGLVKVVVHGGGSDRNHYAFNWQEIEARDAVFQVELGYALGGVQGGFETEHTGVTHLGHQTLRIKPDKINPLRKTPNSVNDEMQPTAGKNTMKRSGERPFLQSVQGGKPLREVAHNKAIERLSVELRELKLEAVTDPDDLEIAAQAEVVNPGSGLEIMLKRLEDRGYVQPKRHAGDREAS